ncbi:crossover junction endonuclease MUS81-like [Teleopsis dalmanni]|uniref:crossover junction endonuclease MUS81-like n=1 Tax=Teleopsis dalmanni TaxID=139649 RepID=UPI0018CF0282|nr:crossover junction endonuclease MUS81-like [Teleopsis dalmanni]
MPFESPATSDLPAQQQRLEITLKCPNPLFEKWLESWLHDAERRNNKSQYKLREALIALRSYPLPLASGRECAVLRGFGTTLCNFIDEELRQVQRIQPQIVKNPMSTYETEVKQIVASVKKAKQKKKITEKPIKISKKVQKALEEEEERNRQVLMQPGTFKILLLVDIQETSGKNKRLLDQTRSYLETLNVQYEVRRLTVGDFLWIARDAIGNELVLPYIVERKRMDDLASSIRDGRFHEQKHRLCQCGLQHVVYLVEDYGDNEHVGLPLDSLKQAMTNTQIQSNFFVTHTENHWRSMSYLQGMTKTLIKLFRNKILKNTTKENSQEFNTKDDLVGLLKFRALYDDSARNAQLTVREVFVQQLLQLHSLSMEKALAIVDVYATPKQLFDAFEACASNGEARLLLANIRCGQLQRPIGEKLSQTIYDFYCTEF